MQDLKHLDGSKNDVAKELTANGGNIKESQGSQVSRIGVRHTHFNPFTRSHATLVFLTQKNVPG